MDLKITCIGEYIHNLFNISLYSNTYLLKCRYIRRDVLFQIPSLLLLQMYLHYDVSDSVIRKFVILFMRLAGSVSWLVPYLKSSH